MSWTAGYIADIDYTFGYYGELNPLRTKLALLRSAHAVPNIETACELGFGQGVSINIHAAASATKWYGTDFNPAQAGFAQDLTKTTGSGAKIFDEAFNDFAHRTDLPDFDYIGLHGIWSWISETNRTVILDFIRRKLKPGGVVYISYNTLPGWAAFSPLRKLMAEYAKGLHNDSLNAVTRIENSITFSEQLLATNPIYKNANPLVADRINQIKSQNRNYLAHEYFNEDWHPILFTDMAKILSSAKLQYSCSAHYLEHVDAINLSNDQISFLSKIENPILQQSARDFIVNQYFRRDFWIKGARKLSVLEQMEQLRSLRFVLLRNRADVGTSVNGALGTATLSPEIYTPILDTLADNKSKSIAQIEAEVKKNGVSLNQLLQAILVLAGQGDVATAQDEQTAQQVKLQCDRLNIHLFNKARSGNDITFVACPINGGGIPMDRFQQLFLLARSKGFQKQEEWVNFVWNILAAQGQKLIKDGKTLESENENKVELMHNAKIFSDDHLPRLKALMVT